MEKIYKDLFNSRVISNKILVKEIVFENKQEVEFNKRGTVIIVADNLVCPIIKNNIIFKRGVGNIIYHKGEQYVLIDYTDILLIE